MVDGGRGYDARRCGKSGKLKALCGCEHCSTTLAKEEHCAVAEEEWAANRRAERQAELSALLSHRSSATVDTTPTRGKPHRGRPELRYAYVHRLSYYMP